MLYTFEDDATVGSDRVLTYSAHFASGHCEEVWEATSVVSKAMHGSALTNDVHHLVRTDQSRHIVDSQARIRNHATHGCQSTGIRMHNDWFASRAVE